MQTIEPISVICAEITTWGVGRGWGCVMGEVGEGGGGGRKAAFAASHKQLTFMEILNKPEFDGFHFREYIQNRPKKFLNLTRSILQMYHNNK